MSMPNILLFTAGFLLGLYILLEGVHDVGRFAGPTRWCMVLRDVSTGLGGLMLMWYAWCGQIDWLHAALALPLALYIWPKMVLRYFRFRGWEGRAL